MAGSAPTDATTSGSAGLDQSTATELVTVAARGSTGGFKSPPRTWVVVAHVSVDRDALTAFCQRYHVHRLSLFGSVLRDDFRPDSDLDVLVEFEPGHTPGAFTIYDMEQGLSSIFGGRKVDLRTKEDLAHWFRDRVQQEAEVQYAAY